MTGYYRGAMDRFSVFFTAIIVFIGLVFVFVLYAGAKNWRAMRAKGIDPITAQAEITARMATGKLIEGPSIEDKLRELDDLHSRGLISDDEHRTGRSRVLGG